MTKEIERAGIPIVQTANLTKIAAGIGSNRILQGNSVLHAYGDPSLPPKAENAYRLDMAKRALHLLEEVPGGNAEQNQS